MGAHSGMSTTNRNLYSKILMNVGDAFPKGSRGDGNMVKNEFGFFGLFAGH